VSTPLAWAIVCGCALGIGLWSMVATMPRLRRARLADRIAPYLLDISDAAREHVARRTVDPLPVIGTLAAPLVSGARSLLARIFGGTEVTARRLRQAGSTMTVDRLRSEQLVWALLGGAVGITAVLVSLPARSLSAPAWVLIPLIGAFIGAGARDWRLRRAASARMARMEEELPTVLEFLTLSLSAGEGILEGLRRVAATSAGELARELGAVVARVGSGVPLANALSEASDGLRLAPLTRTVDQLTAALERGTPLAGVLRAQAQDARAAAKNRLLEVAGRKEVTMLFPLVFLILPLTVVIAILPGLMVLQTGF
jgi:tight adherence protein C